MRGSEVSKKLIFINENGHFALMTIEKNQILIFSHGSAPIDLKIGLYTEKNKARPTVLLRGPNSSIPTAKLKSSGLGTRNYPLRVG